MAAAEVFAGIPVDDFETARAWYEIFAGRPPNVVERANEAAWRLADSGGLHVVADAARAGSGTVTLLVDDLERYVGFIAMRGIAPESIDRLPGGGRRATVLDPAGNTISLVESLGEDAPADG
jgi:predicted enzyme related to lactoylglutathione lyase